MKIYSTALIGLILSFNVAAGGGSTMPDYPEEVTTCYGDANTAIEVTLYKDRMMGHYGWRPNGGDGAYGSLNGVRSDRRIDAEGIFEIEGSLLVSDMAFLLNRDGSLSEGKGELVDQGERSVFKDPLNLTWNKSYKEISCSGNELLDATRDVIRARLIY